MFKSLFIKKIGKRSTRDYLESPLSKDEFIKVISSLTNINIDNRDFLDSFYLRYCSNLFPLVISVPFDSYSKYYWRTECLDIESSSNKDKYWLDRGWSLEETKKIKSSKYGTCSLDYYTSKGHSKNEAESLLKERTLDITEKANKTKKELSESDPSFSKRGGYGINKWLLLGFTEEESKMKVKESQSTFSMKRCIEKYGEVEGPKRFEERQRKWSINFQKKLLL